MAARNSNMMLTTAEVQIHLGNHEARIEPATVEPILRESLASSRFQFTAATVGGLAAHEITDSFVRLQDGELYIPVGLVHRATEALLRNGMRVVGLPAQRFTSRAKPDPWAWMREQKQTRDLAQKLDVHFRGLIVAPNRRAVAAAIGTMMRVLPESRMLVVVNSTADIRRIRARLDREYDGRVDGLHSYDWPFESGRLVVTLKRLRDTEASEFDTVVLADGLKALSPAVATALANDGHNRIYGCVQTVPDNCDERIRLEAAIGPVFHRLQSRGGKAAPVRIAFCTPPWSPPAPSHSAAIERKRTAIWLNAQRNMFIAGIAQAMVLEDENALAGYGIFLNPNQFLPHPEWPSVSILVENTEHGKALLALLPDWKLRRAFVPTPACDPWHRPLHRTILTHLAADQMRVLDTDVLIRADGNCTGGTLQFRYYGPRTTIRARTVLIVDVHDDADDWLIGAWQARRAEYQRLGFQTDADRPLRDLLKRIV